MDMMKKTENLYYINLTERYGHDISVMLKVANDMIISIKKEGGALVHKMIFEK
jgi:hypothetical protein